MNYLVSYANEQFIKRQEELNNSAKIFGIDKTISWTEEKLKKTDFYKKNKNILKQPRGAGYWMWKPYIILEAFKKMNSGDILFYVDSGVEIIDKVKPLCDLCEKQKGILLFNAINKNKFWTKKDCFVYMDCDYKEYFEHSQFMGGYQIYQKSRKSIKFLNEYLKFVQYDFLVDDSTSEAKNIKGFKEHRHDQSVLSNLAIKYGIQGFRNPSQGGNHLKKKKFRVKGEQLLPPYKYSTAPDKKSNYRTIFYNKRNASDLKLVLIKAHSKLPIKLKRLIKNK